MSKQNKNAAMQIKVNFNWRIWWIKKEIPRIRCSSTKQQFLSSVPNQRLHLRQRLGRLQGLFSLMDGQKVGRGETGSACTRF